MDAILRPKQGTKCLARACWLIFWLTINILFGSPGAARGRQEVFQLERGQAAERELSGELKHRYQILLSAGQLMRAVVEQRGLDIGVAVLDPTGAKLAELNDNDKLIGSEEIVVLAQVTGVYLLEISAGNSKAPAGRYQVKLEELVEAGPREQDYIAAQNLQIGGNHLSTQQKAEALREAVGKYESALALWQKLGVRRQESLVLNKLATTHYYLGERPKALRYFQQRLPLVREANNSTDLSVALNNLGLLNWQTGNPQQGFEYLQEALSLRRATGDKGGEAATLHNLGLIYEGRREYQLALDHHLLALPLRRVVGDRSGEAFTLSSLGNISYAQAEYQQAIAYHQQAYAIRRELNDSRNLANTLYSLGAIQRIQGNLQQALDAFTESLALIRPTGYKPNEALTLYEIGNTYRLLGESRQAQDYITESLPLWRALKDKVGEARALGELGQLTAETDAQQAVDYYNQALVLLRSVGSRAAEEAAVLTNLGTSLKKLGQYQQALAHLEQALALARSVDARSQEAGVLNVLGTLWNDLKNSSKSEEYHRQAFAVAQAVGLKLIEARSLYSLAQLAHKAGTLTQGLADVETAISRIEGLRDSLVSPDLRASFTGEFQQFYELQTQILMQLHVQQPNAGYEQKALRANERARARSLAEMLREARVELREDVDKTLRERERGLQQRLNARANDREKLPSNKTNETRLAQLDQEIRTLTSQLEQVRTQLRMQNPRYAALTQPEPLTVAQIQQGLLDEDTMLLEYAFTEGEAYLWAVTAKALTSYRLPPSAEIEAAARRVYDLLNVRQRAAGLPTAQQDKLIAAAEAKFSAEAAALSRMLLTPVTAQLGKKRLLIVAPGALQYVPFAALPLPLEAAAETKSGAGLPLLTAHEIVYLPSASVLAVLRRETAGRAAAPKPVAVLADPVFEVRDTRLKPNSAGGPTTLTTLQPGATPKEKLPTAFERARSAANGDRAYLVRLPHSRAEAEAIAALAPNGLKALDFQANRATAISAELSRYRIVHFATHGWLNSVQPELSGLVFSLLDETGKPQDGFLRLHEVYNLRLPADLVVLSACQTALGKEVKGEGLVGLTRGFMYAGAPRVVASLWQVNDAATADLMKRFYQGMLHAGKRPAAALRAAQLELWKKKPTLPPYFWAAFVLQGEWK